jgi:hypothetical protein
VQENGIEKESKERGIEGSSDSGERSVARYTHIHSISICRVNTEQVQADTVIPANYMKTSSLCSNAHSCIPSSYPHSCPVKTFNIPAQHRSP